VDDTVYVNGIPVPGEDTRMPAIREALKRNELGRTGVGWVLVEHGTPGELPVPGEITATAAPSTAPVVAGNLAALALLAGCVLWQRLPAGKLGVHRREE
jgi:hypothetical protein